MKIYTIWERGLSTVSPWLIAAVDEYTVEYNNGMPESYSKELSTNAENRRELVIEIPDSAVRNIFNAPSVVGKVATDNKP